MKFILIIYKYKFDLSKLRYNLLYKIFEIELKFWVISVFSLFTNTANHITPIKITRL